MSEVIIIEGSSEDIAKLKGNIKKTNNVEEIAENHLKVSAKNDKEMLNSFISEIKKLADELDQKEQEKE